MTKVFDHAQHSVEDDFVVDPGVVGDLDVDGSDGPGKRRHPFIKAFGGMGLALLILIAAITGWGYMKFRAIPKIKIDKAVLGKQSDVKTTVDYDALFFETATGGTAAPEVQSTAPLTAPTVPDAALGDTTPTIAVGNSDSSVTTVVSTPSPRPAPETLVPDDVTILAVDDVTAEALKEADAADAAEVKNSGSGKAPVTTQPPVVFNTVGPGPIVDVRTANPFGGSGTQNYLMIGVDDRKSVPDGQEVGFGVGKVDGSRTDTILILRIDANAHRAWILSIPRDLWVPLAGSGRPSRINSAFRKGPAALVQTIQERLGIPVHHVVQVDFGGFQKVVSTVGGVQVCFERPTRDLLSGLNRPNPGCQMLDARGATAYVRSRHYQQLVNGKWVEDPRSDLGRIIRQQQFIRAVMSRALDQASNPLTVNAMLDDLKSAVAIDSTFTFPETTALANDLRSFDPNTLEAYTLPTSGARVNGAAVLRLNTKAAAPLLAKFRGK